MESSGLSPKLRVETLILVINSVAQVVKVLLLHPY